MARNPKNSMEYLLGEIDNKVTTIMTRQGEIIDRQVGWEKECDARHEKNEGAIEDLKISRAKASGFFLAASFIGGIIGEAVNFFTSSK